MIQVSNAERVVFPEIQRTKGDVVTYFERIAARALPHLLGRPLSIKRYPKGLSAAGFFQKNVPAHYPESIARFELPRSHAASKKHRSAGRERDVTIYPIVSEPEHLPYLANQGAIELHVPLARAPRVDFPDRIVIDLDPKPGAVARARRAARIVRDALAELGLDSVPLATGSKGYHVVAPIQPTLDGEALATALRQLAALLERAHPEELTTEFRVADRGERVFVDWLRNRPLATVIAPYSLRARPLAPVATPLAWDELERTAPDAFTIADIDVLLDRPDPIAALTPGDATEVVARVAGECERVGLELAPFNRFRS